MPILIDGYNLVHAIKSQFQGDLVRARDGLCGLLGEAARYSRERITIVFDGKVPRRGLPQQIEAATANGLQIEYSGSAVTADGHIQRLIDSSTAPRRLWVVTDDRAIRRHARRRRCRCMAALEFWQWTQYRAQGPPRPIEPEEKRRGLRGEGVDDWIREMGLELEGDDDPLNPT